MKKLIPVFMLTLLLTACSQSFHERQLRGTYKVDTRALFQNAAEVEGLGGIAEMIGGALEMKVTFEGEGKARLHLGLGILQELIDAFAGGDAEVSGGASVPVRWKVEGREIYLAPEGEDYELLGRVIDFRGYDEITLEVAQDQGEPLEVTMVRVEDEE
ncbi:MAG TPA: hypothetical protein DCE41_10620 [Cytophagales bacterium]|nr:hypothetical protein [Cytophagales bacterium]HAA21666.1 hypothetical protein [Cytophagales bacterium]HAP63727.1 hypothetical protein [Cytophagales bacterium]